MSCDVFSLASVILWQVCITVLASISLFKPSSFASLLLSKSATNDNPIRSLSVRVGSVLLLLQTLFGFTALMLRRRCPVLMLVYSFMLLPYWFYSLVMVKVNIFYVFDFVLLTIILAHCALYCYPVIMQLVRHLRLGANRTRMMARSQLINRQQEQQLLLLQSAINNQNNNNNNLQPPLLTGKGPVLTSFYSPVAFLDAVQVDPSLVQGREYPIIILQPAIEGEQVTPNEDIVRDIHTPCPN